MSANIKIMTMKAEIFDLLREMQIHQAKAQQLEARKNAAVRKLEEAEAEEAKNAAE